LSTTRKSLLRGAAAAALARIGTPEAFGVLEEAVAQGTRRIRLAARAQLAISRSRRAVRSLSDGDDA